MFRNIVSNPLNLTAALCRRRFFSSSSSPSSFFCSDSVVTQLTRLPSLVEGCDYLHWLVVVEAPKGYPLRDEIVNGYVKTLALVLDSEEEAKKSIYSVSTKYYYAFGCKVEEDLAYKIRSLPNVKWVLPDSYLCHGESGYGGEPFVDGEVVSYDDKYHKDWTWDQCGDECQSSPYSRKARRKRKKNYI
ncbi:multiple organellar RNA editing factor 8, chloroplastic/mitochondrial-like [Melia azedarach]|uniref:Multiple organellar RNA editing factor 8, chloroplastic/mitochondrial-like n=1 Tax=Melia azedarach TaxID=155640 RepID=A0ACC1Y229_MELAZ|nr:multiple organellar RNA editing factor 8, chloroplastic/mitochondrial-like [Melia azedarach]